jgi:hypothetical protein
MNIVYKLKWRRGDLGFWHTLKVIGHQYETGSNKLIVYFPEGGLREIAHWNDCEILLGSDWSKLTNDDSGNTEVVKDKLKNQQDIIPPPPEPDTNIEEISEKKEEEISEKKEEEISEKEEEIDDRNSS